MENGDQNYIVGDDLLYRGVSGPWIDKNSYCEEIWNQFSSCSLDENVAGSFCKDEQNQLYHINLVPRERKSNGICRD